MKLIDSIAGLTAIDKRHLGFVPTMGALHQGHISLVEKARELTDNVAVSIFVNPTQFNNPDDLKKYPRTLEKDLKLLEGLADYAFIPQTADIYGPECHISVNPGPLASLWEGAARPGHFQGVATVVSILFNLIQPEFAVFGEKDFQQLILIENLIKSLHYPIKLIRGATIRESSGLAMSSRNQRLSNEGRERAGAIFQALSVIRVAFLNGTTNTDKLIERGKEVLAQLGEYKLSYLCVVDQKNLMPQKVADLDSRCLVALAFEDVRLIDNIGFS